MMFAETDWVAVTTSIGGTLVTIVGMVLTYLKSRTASREAKITRKVSCETQQISVAAKEAAESAQEHTLETRRIIQEKNRT